MLAQGLRFNKMNIIKEYNLDYCNIKHRDDGIVEFEFADGINVDEAMARELTGMADENLHEPFGLLSNRINSYSLSFEAMSILAHYNNLIAVAIVVHSDKSRLLVETQNIFIAAIKKKPIKIFLDRDSAISWLNEKIQESREHTSKT